MPEDRIVVEKTKTYQHTSSREIAGSAAQFVKDCYDEAEAMLAERAKRMDADPFSPDALSSAARKLHRAGHLTDSDVARICNRIDAAERVREGTA